MTTNSIKPETQENYLYAHQQGLHKGLTQSHISMIAIGGVIGAGLFVGSGVVINVVGPAAIISFLIPGILVVLVMRMLGEMASALPRVGSFYEYARLACGKKTHIGNLSGFLTGWMYWYYWCIVVAIEAVAGANLIQFWIPAMPVWMISLSLLVLLTIINLFSVSNYGKLEFWFASIKVAAILVFLLLGSLFVLGLWPHATIGFSNLMAYGGFMPNGFWPVLSGAVAATGFYFGAEIVTIAASESKEPAIAIAKSTNSVIFRILIFYVCSISLVVLLVPWNSSQILTPFMSALNVIGIPNAASIMNVIVLVAVLSALNSGLYVSSRMLFALTHHGDAPKYFSKVSRHGTPVRAILFGSVFGYIAVIMSYIFPDTVFEFLINSYGTIAIFVYLSIAFSQLRLRFYLERENPQILKIRMWLFPWLTYATIIVMMCLIVSMAFIPEQRASLILGSVSLLILLLVYSVRQIYGVIAMVPAKL